MTQKKIDLDKQAAQDRLWELFYKKENALKDRQLKAFGKTFPVLNIHIPKTGGTSVCSALHIRDSHDPIRWRMFKDPRYSAAKIRAAWIRDPWERALSWYLYGKPHSDHETFELWVLSGADPGWEWLNGSPRMLYQEDWIDYNNKPAINFLGRFETLEADFVKLCERIKFEPPELPHTHHKREERFPYNQYPGYRQDYTPYFTDPMRAILDPMFADFAERFGYKFGGKG